MLSKNARKLFDEPKVKGLDAVVFINSPSLEDPNLYYFGGFEGNVDSGVLIIEKNKGVFLDSSWDKPLKPCKGIERVEWDSMGLLEKELGRLSGKRVGIDYSHLKHSSYNLLKKHARKARFFDISREIARIREVKSAEEVEKIRKANVIACKALRKGIDFIGRGVSELEVALEIDNSIRASGSEPSFSTIVAFGKNSAFPHHVPGKKTVRKGDFVLIDLGARYRHYCSDITRTVVFGKPSSRQELMHKTVLRALNNTQEMIRAGVKAEDINSNVKSIVEKEFRKGMIHSAGHGIGLEVHESPMLVNKSKHILRAGNTIALEPGAYSKSLGGVRLENDYLVGKSCAKKLTCFPLRFEEI